MTRDPIDSVQNKHTIPRYLFWVQPALITHFTKQFSITGYTESHIALTVSIEHTLSAFQELDQRLISAVE
jgi:hypothetical protein